MEEDITQTDETANEDTTGNAAPGHARTDVTRLASDEEVVDIRRLETRSFRRRKLILSVGVLAVIALVIAVVVHEVLGPENPVTWPGETDGAYDDARQVIELDKNTAFLIYWPNAPQNICSGDGTNRFEVVTAIGRRRDVPLHILATVTTLTNNALRTTTDRSYRAWRDSVSDQGFVLDFSTEGRAFLNQESSGFPVRKIDYVRTTSAAPFFGRAFYFRHYEKEFVFLREIPLAELWRCLDILDSSPCLAANLTAVRNHIEIPARRSQGDLATMLSEIYSNISRNLESEDWRRLELKIKTIILTAREHHDTKLEETARHVWIDLRDREDVWYNRKCLEYNGIGELTDDEARNETILAERNHLRRQALDRFPDPDDARHNRIINDDWSIRQ